RDGGNTFTTRQFVSDGGNIDPAANARRFADPRFIFTQNSTASGQAAGQLGIGWDIISSNSGTGLRTDFMQADSGVAANQVAAAAQYSFGGANINDATWGGDDSIPLTDVLSPSIFSSGALAAPADANFNTEVDLDVTLNLVHPHLTQLEITLT